MALLELFAAQCLVESTFLVQKSTSIIVQLKHVSPEYANKTEQRHTCNVLSSDIPRSYA